MVDDASEYGTLMVDGEGRLLGFAEKSGGSGLVSAGVYVFRRGLFANTPRGNNSLELDFVPALLHSGRSVGVLAADDFIDIGTPARLSAARDFVRRHRAWLVGPEVGAI
jgi:NDP-sugar pyrophosphorylase family protein